MSKALGVETDSFVAFWNDTFEKRVTGYFENIRANLLYIANMLNINVEVNALKHAIEIRNTATRYLLSNLREDTIETLLQLKKMGVKLGLISDSTPEVSIIWHETALKGYFDSVIFSDKIKIKKPNPNIYLKMCENLDCIPNKCIYVGDGGSNELSGAESVGIFPILICPTTSEELFLPSRDKWNKDRIETLGDILSYIQ